MDESVGRASVEAVMRSAVAHGIPAVKLKYAGGEASLNHQLMLSLHDYARTLAEQHGIALHSVLLSNGVRLSDTLIDALKTRNIRVMISLRHQVAELQHLQGHLSRSAPTGRPANPQALQALTCVAVLTAELGNLPT